MMERGNTNAILQRLLELAECIYFLVKHIDLNQYIRFLVFYINKN